jgi:hypothetical protein
MHLGNLRYGLGRKHRVVLEQKRDFFTETYIGADEIAGILRTNKYYG